jgi:type IV pilus assembly protein PilC
MPLYAYKATDSQKKIVQGTMVSANDTEVAQILQKQGLDPLTIKPAKMPIQIGGTLPDVEKIALCRYLSTMLTSGVSLVSGLPSIKKEARNPLLKQILDDMLYNLERGQPLSTALANYPKVFNKFFLTLVHAGEVSGTLAEAFKYLEKQLRADYSLSQKIKGSLMYPAIVLIAMTGIGILMFFFVMPQIGKVFLTMTIPLPQMTRTVFSVTLQLANYRFQIIAGLIMAMIGLFLFIRKPTGKKLVLLLVSPLPIVNSLLQEIDIARFCRIFSTLVASAVPITEALDIALSSMNHPKFRNLSLEITQKVSRGKSVADAFAENQAFPAMLMQMISAGEKSGTLDVALGDLANFYEEEVEEAVKKTTQLMEPLVMLIVGIGVGGMILSIIAPLYSVVGNLQLNQ